MQDRRKTTWDRTRDGRNKKRQGVRNRTGAADRELGRRDKEFMDNTLDERKGGRQESAATKAKPNTTTKIKRSNKTDY